jgi:GNAT superfamily N-acetyltransferase
MSVRTRQANPADVPLVLRFVRDLAAYERSADKVAVDEASMREALFSDRPAAEAVIAEIDGKPVGFALFFHNFSTWVGRSGIYLEDLYVDPEARGSGAGKALLAHVARLAVERGCQRFEWAVLDWNEPAIGFYKSLGAAPMDDWTVYRLSGEALARVAGT